jgi:hypothetical protein
MTRQCIFGGPDDFKELARNLNDYIEKGGQQKTIKKILLEKHPDQNRNGSPEDGCLVTVLTGYLDWLNDQPGNHPDTIDHCFELIQENTSQPKSILNMLIDPVFTSPTMTAEFLEMQAKDIFQTNFPKMDYDSWLKGNIKGEASVPSLDEFKKRTAQDKLEITVEEAYCLFLSVALRSSLEALETVHFLLNFALLLRAYEKQTGGHRIRTRRPRRQRKTRQRGGVVDTELGFFTWLNTITVTAIPLAMTGVVVSYTYSDITDPYTEALKENTYSQILTAIGMIPTLYSIYKSRSPYFRIEKGSHFSDETFSRRTNQATGTVDYISTSTTKTWWQTIFMRPADETLLSAPEIEDRLRSLNGRIIHADHGGTDLVNKFSLLLEAYLSTYYRGRMHDVLESANTMDRTNLKLSRMTPARLGRFSETSTEDAINGAVDRMLVTDEEMAVIRDRNLAVFTNMCASSISSRIASEIKLGEMGIEEFKSLSKASVAKVRTADTTTDISTSILFTLGSCIVRESIHGNTIEKKLLTLSAFHNAAGILYASLATYASNKVGFGSIVTIALFLCTLYLILSAFCNYEGSPLALYRGTNYTPTQKDGKDIPIAELIKTAIDSSNAAFAELAAKVDKLREPARLAAAAEAEAAAAAEEEAKNPKPKSMYEKLKTTANSLVNKISVSDPSVLVYEAWYGAYYGCLSVYHFPAVLIVRSAYENSKTIFRSGANYTGAAGLAVASYAMLHSYETHANAVELARSKLRTDLARYTFSLERFLTGLRDGKGGLPIELSDLMEAKAANSIVLREELQISFSAVETVAQMVAAQAANVSAITAREQVLATKEAAKLNADATKEAAKLNADTAMAAAHLNADTTMAAAHLNAAAVREGQSVAVQEGPRSEFISDEVIAKASAKSSIQAALNPVLGVRAAAAAAADDLAMADEFPDIADLIARFNELSRDANFEPGEVGNELSRDEPDEVRFNALSGIGLTDQQKQKHWKDMWLVPETAGGSKLRKSKRKQIKKQKKTIRTRFGGTIPFAERVAMLFTNVCSPFNVFLVIELI